MQEVKYEDVEGVAIGPIRDQLENELALLRACFEGCEIHEYPESTMLTGRLEALITAATQLRGQAIDAVPIALMCALEDVVHPHRMARLIVAGQYINEINWLAITPQVRARSSDHGPVEPLEPAHDSGWFDTVSRMSLMRRFQYAVLSVHIMTRFGGRFEAQETGRELLNYPLPFPSIVDFLPSFSFDTNAAFRLGESAFYVGNGLLNRCVEKTHIRDGLLRGEMDAMPPHVKRVNELKDKVSPFQFSVMICTMDVVRTLISQMTWPEIINIVHLSINEKCVPLVAVPGKIKEMDELFAANVTYAGVRNKWAGAQALLYMKSTAAEIDPSLYKRFMMGADPFLNQELMKAFNIPEPTVVCVDTNVSINDVKVNDKLTVKIGCFTVSRVSTQDELVELVKEHARFLKDHRGGLIMCDAHIDTLVEHFRNIPVEDIKITKTLKFGV